MEHVCVESLLTCIHHNPTNHLGLPLWVINVLALATNMVKKIIIVDKVKTMKEWNKKNYEPFKKCQDSWATFFPLIELLQWNDRKVHNVKCVLCSKIAKKEKRPHYGPQIKHTWETCKQKNNCQGFLHLRVESHVWFVNKKSRHLISTFMCMSRIVSLYLNMYKLGWKGHKMATIFHNFSSSSKRVIDVRISSF
jgi:hypothetical protein